jgi:uncharacterized membrane protein
MKLSNVIWVVVLVVLVVVVEVVVGRRSSIGVFLNFGSLAIAMPAA